MIAHHQSINRSLTHRVRPSYFLSLLQCFADTAHNPYTNARPAVIPGAASDEQAGKMMMDPLKPNNIMSHLPRPKPYQPFQVPYPFILFIHPFVVCQKERKREVPALESITYIVLFCHNVCTRLGGNQEARHAPNFRSAGATCST